MTEPILQFPEKTETGDDNVARLCRQIFICRTRGQIAEASRLETVLENHISAGFDRGALQAIYSNEQKRVLDAVALAEVLGPILTEQLAAATADTSHAPAPTPQHRPQASPSQQPPGIADLIEGMLAQERTARRHAV